MLISTVLALSEFFANNFPNIFWYPYWYLGNPYHYLIGPVVPIALAIVQSSKLIPIKSGQSYDLYLGLILLSIVLGGIGIYFLLRNWRVGKLQAMVSGVLYTVLPLGFFLLNYQSGLNHIAFGFLPFTLLLFRKFLINESKLLVVFLTLTITIMLLTSISILLPLLIGFIALFVSMESKDDVYEKTGKTILIILLSLILSTIWYTPKFWWVMASNPSVGGVPFGRLILSILQFLLQFLPIALAIFVVKLKKYKFEGHLLFGFLFFTSFLFLSFVRFINDPDFVMDWISFGLELQFGGAILAGGVLVGISRKAIGKFVFLVIFVIVTLLNCFIVKDVIVQQWSNGAMEQLGDSYQERIISILKKNVKENERVFLSGSSVFFINSKLNIQQVRGGIDQSSIHPFWAMGAYQIREGENSDLTSEWLKAFGVSYVLVHTEKSREPFRDFKHAEKFSSPSGFVILAHSAVSSGRRTACPESPTDSIRTKRDSGVVPANVGTPQNDGCENRGDLLYRVNNSSIGRIADSSILNVQKPKDGLDSQSIHSYILSLKRPLSVDSALQNQKPDEIAIEENIKQGEVISLAISYDNLWRMVNGKGVIRKDPLGNMVIIPENTGLQKFELVNSRSLSDTVIVLILSILTVVGIAKYDKIWPYVKKGFSRMSLGLHEEEE